MLLPCSPLLLFSSSGTEDLRSERHGGGDSEAMTGISSVLLELSEAES
jgi:hypothetical protein